jgi:hypothetical protein
MGPDTVHFIVHPHPFLVQVAFNDQGGVLVRDHTNRPSGCIGRLRRISSVDQNFPRCGVFVARAKWTKATLYNLIVDNKICGASTPLPSNYDPAPEDRILT